MDQTAPQSALLKKVDCFSSLDDGSLALLEGNMRTEPFPEGATICSEGDAADWMFIVASGEVRVEKSTEDGGVIQVAVLKTGDVGGMQSLFEKTPRAATLRAHVDTQLWVLDPRDIPASHRGQSGHGDGDAGFHELPDAQRFAESGDDAAVRRQRGLAENL